jgi:hypothetical protein
MDKCGAIFQRIHKIEKVRKGHRKKGIVINVEVDQGA